MPDLEDKPEKLLEPWRESTADPWDRRRAFHLLTRAGFGTTPSFIEQAVAEGLDGTLERVFAPSESDADARTLRSLGDSIVGLRDIDKLGAWWLQIMINTPDPLRENCALLWHGHFAVSAAKVDSTTLLYEQYRLFHEHGLGDLRELARQVTRSPAMLKFLDADSNRKGHPNENLARELMELFLLGIGNYTEKDIQEAARALTGLRVRGGKTEMVERYHDASAKRVFGAVGRFDPDTLVSLCLDQEAAAQHLSRRLVTHFVHPDPPPRLSAALGARLRADHFQVAPFLKWLFRTRFFHHPACYRCLIKCPVQFAVGAIRMLGARVDGNSLHRALEAMGQRLFHPPGVQGWSGGTAWMSSGRLVARNRFAADLANRDGGLSARYALDELDELGRPGLRRLLVERFLGGEVDPAVGRTLDAYDGAPRGLRHLILTLPEFQLA